MLNLLNGDAPTGKPDGETLIRQTIPVRLKSLGKQKRLIIEGTLTQVSEPNPELIRAVALGPSWHQTLMKGEFTSQKALADHLRLTEPQVARYLQVGVLAPDIVENILAGTQPIGLTLARLYKVSSSDWQAQRRELGFSE